MQERERFAVEVLPILGESSTAIKPGNAALDDPAFGQNDEGVQLVALDDFDNPMAAAGGGECGARPPIARVGKDANNEGKQLPRARIEHESSSVAILDIGRVNGRIQQQAERIYENVALLALDLLSRIVAVRIDARPPFSALFTLWLSMIAAVGLASRSSRSLHFTYSS